MQTQCRSPKTQSRDNNRSSAQKPRTPCKHLSRKTKRLTEARQHMNRKNHSTSEQETKIPEDQLFLLSTNLPPAKMDGEGKKQIIALRLIVSNHPRRFGRP
jgi:hypothetical protein